LKKLVGTRHVGFYAYEEIVTVLKKAGIIYV